MSDKLTVVAGDRDANTRLAPNFASLISMMAARENVDPELARRLLAVQEIVGKSDVSRPFLTVLLRTQGRRQETFKDALLCLSAQADQDFEVIVLEHNASPEDAADVKDVVSKLAPDFAERVRLIEVEGGLRGKPLNAGVDAANGRYVAVFDDDDLLFANWVEAFHQVSERADGRLLRAVVANQSVSPELWPQDHDGFRTLSWPKVEFPVVFDQLNHLVMNYSPFMSWAFPRSLFYSYGLRFDEELTVCEDWDVIVQGSLICGVTEVPELTSIYRRWEGGVSSYTSHSTDSWRSSEQRVIDRLNEGVLTLPPGSTQRLRDLLIYNEGLHNYRFLFNGNQLRGPLLLMWKAAAPGMRMAVRLRNKVRRMRSR